MSIKKVRGLESNFSIIPNDTINDSLSWGAKGLLTYLCSKPDDWSVSVQQLCNHSKLSSKPTGRDGTYTVINELISKGYMQRVQARTVGQFANAEYIVSATPLTDSPHTDKADTAEPLTANPTLQSKEIYKEQIDTKKVFIEAFDHFWLNMALPKRSKPASVKSFLNLAKSEPDAMAFANQLIQDTKTRFNNKQFGFDKLHPSSYLNGKRWEDDHSIDKQQQNNKPTIAGDGSDWRRFESEML